MDFDTAWLAGLLEGEGSFGWQPDRGYRYPRIVVSMTDKDVIERAASILGVAALGPYKPGRSSKLPFYRAQIAGSRAAVWMRTLAPFMGVRRQARIGEVLAEYDQRPSPNQGRREWSQAAAAGRSRDAKGRFV